MFLYNLTERPENANVKCDFHRMSWAIFRDGTAPSCGLTFEWLDHCLNCPLKKRKKKILFNGAAAYRQVSFRLGDDVKSLFSQVVCGDQRWKTRVVSNPVNKRYRIGSIINIIPQNQRHIALFLKFIFNRFPIAETTRVLSDLNHICT